MRNNAERFLVSPNVAAGLTLAAVLAGASPALAACPITADQAAIFTASNLGGSCRVLAPGMYATAAQFGLPDNSISSLVVGANVSVTLYDIGGRIGIPSTSFDTFWPSGYTVNYVGGGFNDKTSAIQVKSRFPQPIRLPGVTPHQPVAGAFLGDSPANFQGFWTQDPQGLAHDNQNFYITNTQYLYRYSLTSSLTGRPYSTVQIPPTLRNMGCNHFGDPDARYAPGGQSYIFVPVEGCSGGPVVAVFDQNLAFVTFDQLFAPEQEGHASWLALHQTSDGRTWISSSTYGLVDGNHPIVQYELDWGGIYHDWVGHYFLYGGYNKRFLAYENSVGGKDSAALYDVQGGVFSDDGSVFYLANGAAQSGLSCPNAGYQGYGIHAFRTTDYTGIGSSSNGRGSFNYENHPCSLGDWEEVEGIDYVNMWNRGGAFNGFLHGVMVSNRSTDAAYIKHFNQ